GPAIALLVGAATSSVRDQVGASGVGISLAIVVVLAALISRGAGIATAIAAALSFNYFHSQPYHSLRIHQSSDVVVVALLAGLGLVVSDISAWRRRRETIAFRLATAQDAPRRITEMLHEPHPVGDVWPGVTSLILDQLALADVWFDPSQDTKLPLVSMVRSTATSAEDGFVLPAHGAAMPIVAGADLLGHLILRPQHGITSLWVERRVALALADHLTIALTYTGHE
ncbi:unnamed protein product, partial [Phaeothamnion confervicola]